MRLSSGSYAENLTLYPAYAGQPFFAVALLALRFTNSGSIETGLAALLVPAEDQEQAEGIGRAYLRGRWSEDDGWAYEIAVTSFHA